MSFLLYSDVEGKDCPHREPLGNVQESCGKRKRSARLVLGEEQKHMDWFLYGTFLLYLSTLYSIPHSCMHVSLKCFLSNIHTLMKSESGAYDPYW